MTPKIIHYLMCIHCSPGWAGPVVMMQYHSHDCYIIRKKNFTNVIKLYFRVKQKTDYSGVGLFQLGGPFKREICLLALKEQVASVLWTQGTGFCQQPMTPEVNPKPKWDYSPSKHLDLSPVRFCTENPANPCPNSWHVETNKFVFF